MLLNATRRSFALPVFTAALMLIGSATASAAACPTEPTDLTTETLPCRTGDDRPTVATQTPKLRAKITGDQLLDAEFVVRQGRTRVVELTAKDVLSGSFAEVTLPQHVLAENTVYRWEVRASDGRHHSKWVGGCEFQVDLVAPNQPAASSADYPTSGFHGSPGRTGIFTFSPNGSTDVVRYGWSLNVDTFANQVDAAQANSVPITPTQSGPNVLYVRAYDKAGNPSARQTYSFMVADAPRPSAPVAAWKFDETEGTTAADTTGNGHPLTLNGATFGAGYAQNGQVNIANSFSSTASAIVDTSRAFSVSAWVKLDVADTTYTVASQDGDQDSGFALRYSADPSQVGVWTHLVGVYESGKMSLYVNGKLDGATDVALTNASGPFVVGAGKSAGARVGQVQGTIDHVQVWDRVLTAAEAAKHSNLVALRAHYNLDEREGVTTKDEVSGQHGTLSGGVTWAGTLVDPDDPNQVFTSKDKWARFDSSGQVTGPRPANLRTDRSYTVSAWVRHDEFGGAGGTVVGMADSPFVLGYRPDTGKWGFQLAGGAAVVSDVSAESNRWVHLAATFDAATGTIALYFDGMKQTSTQTGLQAPNGAGDLVLGHGVTGAVDDVRLYSGVMVEQDVLVLRSASMH